MARVRLDGKYVVVDDAGRPGVWHEAHLRAVDTPQRLEWVLDGLRQERWWSPEIEADYRRTVAAALAR